MPDVYLINSSCDRRFESIADRLILCLHTKRSKHLVSSFISFQKSWSNPMIRMISGRSENEKNKEEEKQKVKYNPWAYRLIFSATLQINELTSLPAYRMIVFRIEFPWHVFTNILSSVDHPRVPRRFCTVYRLLPLAPLPTMLTVSADTLHSAQWAVRNARTSETAFCAL